jgi:hypothetical protein
MRNIVFAILMLGTSATAQLRVTVYDKAHLPTTVLRDAMISLGDVFRASGIAVEFVSGDLEASEASLMNLPMTPRKGQEREAACRARRDIALEISPSARPGLRPTILGEAQPLARYRLHARVYMNLVMDTAAFHNRSTAAVLAYVVAHEIGHVLLRTSQHNPRGLMSEVWTDLEYNWMTVRAMLFTKAQAKTMRDTLGAAGCVSASNK